MPRLVKNLFLVLFVFVFLLVLSPKISSANAATYYVSSTGSGTTCSMVSPCTLFTANGKVAAGDTVIITDNTTADIIPAVSGTSTNPITYRGEDGGEYVKRADIRNKSYINIEGLTFNSVGSYWISTNDSSDYINISNSTFNSTDPDGIANHAFIGVLLNGDYNTLRNNVFLTWYGGDTVQVGGDYAIIEENDFSKADAGHGNVMLYGSYTIVRNNYFRNRIDRALEISAKNGEKATNRLVENNIIFDSNWNHVRTYPSGMYREGSGDVGTDQIAKVGGSITIFRNNLVVATNEGKDFEYAAVVQVVPYDQSYYWEHLRVYHNTFYDNPHNGITFDKNAATYYLDDNVVKNNIIANSGKYSININNSSVPFNSSNENIKYTIENNILTDQIRRLGSPSVYSVSAFESAFSSSGTDRIKNNLDSGPSFINDEIIGTAKGDTSDETLISFLDFSLANESAGRHAATSLTTVTNSGTSTTDEISVADSYYFFDGYGLENGDEILIDGQTTTVTDVVSKTLIKVSPAIEVTNGDEIYLAEFGDNADIGIKSEVIDASHNWIFDSSTASDYTYDSSFIEIDSNGVHPITSVNKINNPSFVSDNSAWNISAVTPSGWVEVPGDSNYSTNNFLVMKYEAKYDCNNNGVGDSASVCNATADNGLGLDWRDVNQSSSNVVSSAVGAPIVHITQTQAIGACPIGSHLITNNEWMTIARNAETQNINWANGIIGSLISSGGGLKRGNTGSVDSTSYNGTDADSGTNRDAKAKLVLSNGAEIWDLSGNVWEWTSDTIQRKDHPLAWNGSVNDETGFNWSEFSSGGSLRYIKSYKIGSPLQAINLTPSNSSYRSAHGVGRIYHYSSSTDTSTTNYGYLRGSYWTDVSNAGLFSARISTSIGSNNSGYGFRCAININNSQNYLATSGRNSEGGNNVSAATNLDTKFYQSINLGDTSTYEFSAYVYNNSLGSIGGVVDSSVVQLYYDNSSISTNYTNMGNGWWKITGTLIGANALRDVGLYIKAGKTIIVDNFTLSKQGEYSAYTSNAHFVEGLFSWNGFASTETSSADSSVSYQICTDDGNTCQNNSTWKYWDGDSWEIASSINDVNSASEITNAVMTALPTDSGKLSVKAFFNFAGVEIPNLASVSVN